MENSEFEWDEDKAESNLKKHHVSFAEAATIFNDPNIASIPDPDHSEVEDRFISIGRSFIARILIVIHTFRNTRIRLISARKATKAEKKKYENR
ncbi:MAG: hypothetical protein RIR73_2301 [Chloroflexota bacterium]|jgi:uncharacterized DUF497 family protein